MCNAASNEPHRGGWRRRPSGFWDSTRFGGEEVWDHALEIGQGLIETVGGDRGAWQRWLPSRNCRSDFQPAFVSGPKSEP